MEKSLCQAIVVRAIKDYVYVKYKPEIVDWVMDMNPIFGTCAEAIGVNPWYLREIMVDKMIQIDTYGTITLYNDNKPARMRK